MPKLTDIHAHASKRGGIYYNANYPCKVLADGSFWAAIPDDELEAFTSVLECFDGLDLQRDKTGKMHVVGSTLASLKRVCSAHAKWKIEATQEIELRIFYEAVSRASFWVTDNGQIAPNGTDTGSGNWFNGGTLRTSGRGAGAFAVGVGATIVRRVVTTPRTGAPALTYEQVRAADEELGPEGKRLKQFTGQLNPEPPFRGQDEPPSVPYTEEAAKFFADRLQELCEEADRIARFFDAEPEKIASDIAAGVSPFAARN